MSFSSEIKGKLVKIKGECKTCSLYELAGFIGNAGKITKDALILSTENKAGAERISQIINKIYREKYLPEFHSGRYKISIDNGETALRILEDTGYFKEGIFIENECCKGAYARGAFLGGGSISDPEKSYHLEFDYKYLNQAKKLDKILDECGIGVKETERKGHIVIYVKEYEAIAGILGAIGAGGAAVKIYSISAEKELRNEINRQMNCENANMDKIVSAYGKHIKAIDKIMMKMGLDKLPDTLREAAEIRVCFPEDSLKDLGAHFNPPIGKSGVNHRLNRLVEIADNL